MALAIDASTPAWVDTTVVAQTLTTASFAPPLGALLVVCYGNDWNADTQIVPLNTGGAVTWDAANAASEAANGCAAAIWFGRVTTSASMTVTIRVVGANNDGNWGGGVAVVTGQATAPKGGTQIATSASGTPSGTITSLQRTNSLIIGVVANFTNATGPSIPAGQSDVFGSRTFLGSGTGARWAQYLTGMNLASGASATINDTAPTAIAYSLAMVEIMADVTVPQPAFLSTNTLSRGVRNLGQIATFLRRVPQVPVVAPSASTFIAEPPLVLNQAPQRASYW